MLPSLDCRMGRFNVGGGVMDAPTGGRRSQEIEELLGSCVCSAVVSLLMEMLDRERQAVQAQFELCHGTLLR